MIDYPRHRGEFSCEQGGSSSKPMTSGRSQIRREFAARAPNTNRGRAQRSPLPSMDQKSGLAQDAAFTLGGAVIPLVAALPASSLASNSLLNERIAWPTAPGYLAP